MKKLFLAVLTAVTLSLNNTNANIIAEGLDSISQYVQSDAFGDVVTCTPELDKLWLSMESCIEKKESYGIDLKDADDMYCLIKSGIKNIVPISKFAFNKILNIGTTLDNYCMKNSEECLEFGKLAAISTAGLIGTVLATKYVLYPTAKYVVYPVTKKTLALAYFLTKNTMSASYNATKKTVGFAVNTTKKVYSKIKPNKGNNEELKDLTPSKNPALS
ncbi:hypothetical protein KJ644_01665 [Candidatus Dependentiae bacterium]|nr:hypothetical protein [Candidatus Dependentiae bacterium]MBU4387159.1 hypothetical protein [Candidatus Dependentiae bacterium]MCG2756744.1 hypothetical protein [Candidatus Dependentiae bacterium]